MEAKDLIQPPFARTSLRISTHNQVLKNENAALRNQNSRLEELLEAVTQDEDRLRQTLIAVLSVVGEVKITDAELTQLEYQKFTIHTEEDLRDRSFRIFIKTDSQK